MENPSSLTRWLITVVGVSILLFLCLPIAIVIPMSFSSADTLAFPPPSLSLRWYRSFFEDPRWLEAARTSLFVALASSTLAVLFGSAAAYGLVRGTFGGRRILEANFLAPIIVPQVITALALYMYLAKFGLLGTFGGLILGHTILGLPYVVLLMSVAIRSFDVRIEQAALSLGASWQEMFRRVLIPNLMPSLLAAWIFAFIISFDEVIVTIFLSGAHETIPKKMFNELVLRVNPTITAIATLLIGFTIITMGLAAWLAKRGSVSAIRGLDH
ncbi:ABC-type spermidine/putrescine transport system permease subunit II [Rhodoligotrophos appendicifer]|uniref:ABC transporter permease n=1 Tax=Rhodoligotrophos appendicifer TaxID=987056 RepID=UPI001187133A|nr:ABC transporter permease [Rhodoligotrophos appendicifer]